jgi:hypothetical protein
VRPLGPDGKPAERTRAQELQRSGKPATLPPAPAYLLAWLHELGICQPGPEPLPASEIAAWASGAGHRLQPWEFSALQEASRAFVAEYQAGNPLPPDQPAHRPDQQALSQKLKGLAAQINRKPAT